MPPQPYSLALPSASMMFVTMEYPDLLPDIEYSNVEEKRHILDRRGRIHKQDSIRHRYPCVRFRYESTRTYGNAGIPLLRLQVLFL